MSNRIIDAMKTANRLIGDYMAVKPGEEVLIVVDPETDMSMPRALAAAASTIGAEYTIAMMPSRHGGEKATSTTAVIVAAVQGADVYIGLTRSSGAAVYDRRIFDPIKQGRLRMCSMVMRDLVNFTQGGALADYEALDREGRALAGFWRKQRKIRITSPGGTDLRADIGQNGVIVECGLARNPGEHMAFSDGEVSQAPDEATLNGTLIIDGPICQLGLPQEPIVMAIAGGKLVSVEGGDPTVVRQLHQLLDNVPHANHIAEIGLGLNPASLLNGDFEEEKKARGTCHLALGDDLAFGGNVKCDVHLDMVMYRPTVQMDDTVVVAAGDVVTESFAAG